MGRYEDDSFYVRTVTRRDAGILRLLWQAKLLPTAANPRWFFPDVALATAYRRLWKLKQHGWIKQRPNREGTRWYWTLTKEAHRRFKEEIPRLHEDGFETEWFEHDAGVAAIHVGSAFALPNDSMEIVTEQWLRRAHKSCWPPYVPTKLLHRPDGYWLFWNEEENKQRSVAFEYERQPKGQRVYLDRALGYHLADDVDHVIWVAQNDTILRSIARAVFTVAPEANTKHSIFRWRDFVTYGFNMPCVLGRGAGRPLRELLQHPGAPCSPESLHQYFLDGSKSGAKSLRYRREAKLAGFDCITRPSGCELSAVLSDSCRHHLKLVTSNESDGSLKSEAQPAVENPQGDTPWQS